MGERCDYCIPGYMGYIAGKLDRREQPDCLLRRGHEEAHLVQFSDGRYVEWQPGEECDDPEGCLGHCDCFVYEQVSAKEAQARIKAEGPSS
jgi:hypothetical protein